VTGGERGLRRDRPVAARGVDVGVADAAGHHADQHLPRARLGHRDVPDLQRGAQRRNHCGLHRVHVRPLVGTSTVAHDLRGDQGPTARRARAFRPPVRVGAPGPGAGRGGGPPAPARPAAPPRP
jgi:hypothetical protein